MVALKIELSAIRLSDEYGLQPSTTISSVGCVGIEPLSIAPNDLCQPLHFTPDIQASEVRLQTSVSFLRPEVGYL